MIRDLKVEELTSRFEVLKEIADLLCMPNPASLPSLLRGGTLASLDLGSIYPYLRCREDFVSADLPRLLGIHPDSFSPQAHPTSASNQQPNIDDHHTIYPMSTATSGSGLPPSTNLGVLSAHGSTESLLSSVASPQPLWRQ